MTKAEFYLLDFCFQGMEEVYMTWWLAKQPPSPPATGTR
jgi:hypothetical protein